MNSRLTVIDARTGLDVVLVGDETGIGEDGVIKLEAEGEASWQTEFSCVCCVCCGSSFGMLNASEEV